MKISLAMIVKNEEKYIERCIESAFKLVDDVVVVDTGSTDNTLNILKKYKNIRLFHFEWCDDFSKARNFSIGKAEGDYILVLDGDEYISVGNRNEFLKIMSQNSIGRILIESKFKKDNHTFYAKEYVSRFFPRDVKYSGAVHEQLDSDIPRVKMDVTLKHDGYYKTNKSTRNIPLLLNELKNNPTDSYYLFQLGKELRINKKFEEAFHFLLKSYANIDQRSAFYGELVVELINCGKEGSKAVVLDVIEKNDIFMKNVADFHFAKGIFYLEYCLNNPERSNNYIHLIESSFLTCLELNGKVHSEYLQGTSSFLSTYNLGVYYEVTGNFERALLYYKLSANQGYEIAETRLKHILNLA